MKIETIIAIDPDVKASGVATLEVNTQRLEVSNMTFPEIVDYFSLVRDEWKKDKENHSVTVIVEAGWKNTKSNFHVKNDRAGQKVAKNVGANHQTGKHIIEMAEYYGLPVKAVPPLRKMWKGRDKKITHDEIVEITGLIAKRSNQEMRDAALLAWVSSGLPMKIHRY